MSDTYDAIIIGTGQAGPALAVRLAKAGSRTAIIERKLFGGTCVNVGCVPTKTLVASARAAYMARRAAEYGVIIAGGVRVDMVQVKARMDAVVKQSSEGLVTWLRGTPNLTVFPGHGRLESARSVRVDGMLLEAKEIFLNVGARALVPDIPGLADIDYLTNSSMMEIDSLPEHLIILGGSYIGLEFAQMYRRFGSRVTIVEKGPRLIAREDEAVSATIKTILEDEGIAIRLNTECLSVAPHAEGVVLDLKSAGVSKKAHKKVTGSHLLLALGRVPNTDDLGLDTAGVAIDEHGYIVVDDQLRTNVAGIWALGDANGRGAFTHTAYNDYEIVAGNLLDKDTRRVTDRIPAYALYIDPPLARVGMTEQEVRSTGRPALVGRLPMSRVGRARERGETLGSMSVLVDEQSKKILGAALLGIEADEAIHAILDVMYADVPYTVMQRAMHIHPTVSELIPTLLGDLKPLV